MKLSSVSTGWLNILLALFVFLLPWQARWIVQAPMLNGGVWEYGVTSLYATEVLLWVVLAVGYLTLWRSGVRPRRLKFNWAEPKTWIVASAYLLVAVATLSLVWAWDREVGLRAWFRLVEGAALFFLLAVSPVRWLALARAGAVAAAVQGVVAVEQFFVQSVPASAWLGMAAQSADRLGASVVELADGRWLRAYGTLPHPNLLAGFLAVGILLAAAWYVYPLTRSAADHPLPRGRGVGGEGNSGFPLLMRRGLRGGPPMSVNPRRQTLSQPPPHEGEGSIGSSFTRSAADHPLPRGRGVGGEGGTIDRVAALACGALAAVGLVLTFSRTGIAAAIVGLLAALLVANRGPARWPLTRFVGLVALVLAATVALVLPLAAARAWGVGRLEQRSAQERADLTHQACILAGQRWLGGVGIGNATVSTQRSAPGQPGWAYQPAHDVWLAVTVELGVFGALALLGLVAAVAWRALAQRAWLGVGLLAALVVAASFDHYVWTLYPGIMLWWVGLGMAARVDFLPLERGG